jgi:tRNA pseudouridine13 synthase
VSQPAFDPIRLPYVTDAKLAIGGRIKREPSHFIVEEIPLYEPCGTGEHVYLRCRREGRTTLDVIDALARCFGIRARDIGYAGLKDKQARATQTFSLPLAGVAPDDTAERARSALGIEVLSARRHANKLRRGHSIGNRFHVLIEDVSENALAAARAIAREIGVRGLPNFYGPQRFGADAKNAERGRRLLHAPRSDARSRLMLSALQSHLFNAWLAERVRIGRFDVVSPGDVGKRVDNGALFDVVDEEAENARMQKHEITYTGPMYGARMRPAHGAAGELEGEILRRHEIDVAEFARAGLDGSRRAARIFVDDLEIAGEASCVHARFSLPKGAYATVLLRELMKTEACTADIDDDA